MGYTLSYSAVVPGAYIPIKRQENDTINAIIIHLLPNKPATNTDCNIDLDRNECNNCNVVNVAKACVMRIKELNNCKSLEERSTYNQHLPMIVRMLNCSVNT